MLSTAAMAGTALSILSPYTRERVEPILIEEMRAEGLTPYQGDPEYWQSADGLPYGYDIQSPGAEAEPEDLRIIEAVVGEVMTSDIVLHIFVSDVAGRPALARVAQRVAGRTEGWVFAEFGGTPSADLLRHLLGAGRCIRVEGDALYLDAAATSAWINHPEFFVIK